MENKNIKVGNLNIANNLPFVLIAGPCQVESLDHSMLMAQKLLSIANKLGIDLIYKSSFDKANRSSSLSKRGIGMDESLKIFQKIKQEFNLPIITDVHNEDQCKPVAEVVDILQIPAFLCRQNDLLKAASLTGKVVNVKKGQFLAPWDAANIVKNLESFNAFGIMLTERGTSFGYNNLVSDMRSLAIMSQTGYPVIFDATHSVQRPGGLGQSSGGDRQFVELLSRCAVAAGIAGLFLETHQDPDNAPSDGPCMLHLDSLEALLAKLKRLDQIIKQA